MIIRQVPWPDVEPWSQVLADDGGVATVLPNFVGAVSLLFANGQIAMYAMPPTDRMARVLEPELPDAIRNLLTAFTVEDVIE